MISSKNILLDKIFKKALTENTVSILNLSWGDNYLKNNLPLVVYPTSPESYVVKFSGVKDHYLNLFVFNGYFSSNCTCGERLCKHYCAALLNFKINYRNKLDFGIDVNKYPEQNLNEGLFVKINKMLGPDKLLFPPDVNEFDNCIGQIARKLTKLINSSGPKFNYYIFDDLMRLLSIPNIIPVMENCQTEKNLTNLILPVLKRFFEINNLIDLLKDTGLNKIQKYLLDEIDLDQIALNLKKYQIAFRKATNLLEFVSLYEEHYQFVEIKLNILAEKSSQDALEYGLKFLHYKLIRKKVFDILVSENRYQEIVAIGDKYQLKNEPIDDYNYNYYLALARTNQTNLVDYLDANYNQFPVVKGFQYLLENSFFHDIETTVNYLQKLINNNPISEIREAFKLIKDPQIIYQIITKIDDRKKRIELISNYLVSHRQVNHFRLLITYRNDFYKVFENSHNYGLFVDECFDFSSFTFGVYYQLDLIQFIDSRTENRNVSSQLAQIKIKLMESA